MASTSESTRTDGTPRSRSIAQSVSTGIQEIGTKVSQGIEKVVSIRSRASGRGSQRVTRNEDEDQQALIWASLEKLPTYERLRTSILNGEETGAYRNVDVRSLLPADRSSAIDKIIGSNPEADNEKFLQKLRDRLDKVGIELPRVELRYEHLTITAQCHVGGRALPTLWNATMNFIEGALNTANLTISKKTTLTILDDMSGVIQPARMTLLLGPPTCGKTTLLLALADLLAANLKVSGKVTYNGHEMDEFVPQKTSVYVSQMDLHQGELTVRETLDFSARCQGVGSRFDLVEELCVREKDLGICPDPVIDIYLKATAVEGQKRNFSTEYILKMLGLDVCADTVVGNNMMRGISGGQKKRTTTGEMIVGPSRVLLMDQITDGLDSSTAFQIVKCLSQLARYLDYTVIISLLQPAPEAFNLFDDILLMAEGHVVYHGPRSQAMDFFETLGFVCPPRKAVPDYLQELTSRKDQGQYWADKSKPYRFISVKELAEAFKNYPVGMNMLSTLSIPFEKSDSHKAALAFNTYGLPSKEIFKTVFERELLLMKRNSFVWIFRLGQIIFLALIAMGMYIRPRMHRRNLNDAQIFNAAQFFGITNVLFNGYLDLALTVGRLPVFFKQRQLHMFPAWTYALSVFVLGIPITLIEAPSWAGITYYTIGFAPFIGRFFRYILLLILLHTSAGAMFRAIAGLCRTMVISNSGGSAVLLLIFTLGGLLIPRKTIKSWWIWGYWISPLSYANNGISVNEFMAPQWKKYPSGLIRSLGVQYLYSVELFHRGYWYWIAILALACFAIGYNVLFGLAVTYMRPIGGPRAIIPEHELEEKQATRTGTASAGSSTSGHMKSEETRVDIEPTSRTRPGRTSPSPERHGMILPFHPYAMSFTNLSYSVEMPAAMRHEGAGDKLKLLHNITGTFRPGVLTALMGVTGAGKTTLMDVLAGRKTGGYIEGDIRISGFPKVQETFARIAGYCEQTDIHSSQVTVEESLIYSAWLRLPHEVTDEQRTQFVEEVMDLVELRDVKTGLVGIPGQTGLSHEQRKRLTIGVELVANPSIIFMDEPTSGLDARAAAIVMRAVRNTVDTGRTVVCTIHQPSIDIFESFDELVLMKRGGRLIYAGHLGRMSKDLIEYFETTVPDIPKYRDGMNPATWMLEISTPAVESRLGLDFAEIYNKSPLFEKNEAIAAELSHPVPGDTDLEFPTKFSRPWVNQFTACLWKQNRTYYRSPDYVNVRFLFTGIAAAFMGTLFWRLGHKRHSQKSIYSVMGSLYASILFIGVTNAQTIQPLIASERNAYYRERAAGMYSPLPYALAQILNEVPYAAVQGVLYTIITYPMLYLEWTASKFFWHIYFLFTVYIAFTYYGMVAVSITPSAEFASVVGSGFYQIFNLFAGFLIPKPRIPPYYVWIYWATPTAYALYGLVVSQYGDLHGPDHMMTTITGDQRSVASWVADHFDFKHGFIGGIAALSLVYPLVFGIIFTVAMTKLNFQTR